MGSGSRGAPPASSENGCRRTDMKNQFTNRSNKMSNSMTPMRVVRGVSQSVCIVLLQLTCGALSAQDEQRPIRNIVLVHGAWADGSGWKGVYDILVKDG